MSSLTSGTPRSARGQLSRLLHALGELAGQLEQAVAETGLVASEAAGIAAPQQQSLLWVFEALLQRLPRPPAAQESPDGWPASHPARVWGDPPRRQDAGVARVVDAIDALLEQVDSDIIWRELVAEAPEQPLVHAFERLFSLSNQSLRRGRGVYFTPYPLVQYILRSVDSLLQSELGVRDGLVTRETSLRIIDPACGSGAFLLGVLQYARERILAAQGDATWPSFAESQLLPSLTGIDVMPACCGASGLLVRQFLARSGGSAPMADQELSSAPGGWSAHCGNPLSDVQLMRRLFAQRVPVIVGNPPYANFGRRNREPWILAQLDEYKRGLNEKKLNLNDDYIKFMRWAQYWIDQAPCGMVAMVTNNTWLNGITHRRMRASLCETFDQLYLLDLHGSSKKRETAPDGREDENVFPIQQGVAISLLVKTGRAALKRRVMHAELWGTRGSKLQSLAVSDVGTIRWKRCDLQAPWYLFTPPRASAASDDHAGDYYAGPKLDEIFSSYISGVQTKCDSLFVGFARQQLEQRIERFLRGAAVGDFAAEIPGWLRDKAVGVAFDPRCIRPYMVAPLDVRWVYYEPRLLGRARQGLLRDWVADSPALVFMRQAAAQSPYDYFLVTEVLVSDRVFYSAHGAPFLAPLLVRRQDRVVANLRPDFLDQLEQRIGIAYGEQGGKLPYVCGPQDVMHWLYAAAHDRSYRRAYHDLLCVDFPRIAWPHDRAHFLRLCQLGQELVEAHCRVPDRNASEPGEHESGGSWTCPGPPQAMAGGYPVWEEERLSLSRQCVWPHRVPPDVWQFRMGGYQVLPRWLKQRRRRLLTPTDLNQLATIIDALQKTTAIMDQIDPR